MKFPFFKKSKPEAPSSSLIHPILTAAGIMLCIQRPGGGFESREIAVPATSASGGRPWFVGEPVRLNIVGTRLEMTLGPERTSSQLAAAASDAPAAITIYDGLLPESEALLLAVRHAWLNANLPKTLPTAASDGPINTFTPPPQSSSLRKKYAVGLALAGVVGLVAAGAGGMQLYLGGGRGPGLDLTAMSVNEVAQLDLNPAAVRSMQEQLLAAVKSGQDEATKMTGAVEANHLGALKSMGLDPGVSAKNAMSCLATK